MAQFDLTDTHCHIHEATKGYNFSTETRKKYIAAGSPSPDSFIREAQKAGVTKLICVGTTLEDSELAVEFVQTRPGTWASIGIHPHEAQKYLDDKAALTRFAKLAVRPKIVAIGECGLDFYYKHSPRQEQETILRFQLELARKHDLPLIFHVRAAFPEFWQVFDNFSGVRGVIHSFSSNKEDLQQALQRGLYIGLNGIATFMKDEAQLAAVKHAPIDRLVLETDAPFLTPVPYRGKVCEPKHVRVTAEFLAKLRAETLETLARKTNANVQKLFRLE